MRRFVSLWPAAVSAVLAAAAFPPFNLSLLVFVALVPLFQALRTATPRRSVALGYVFGFVYMVFQLQMLQTIVAGWTHNLPLSFVPWLLGSLIGAWYFALFGWLANRAFRHDLAWLTPLVWGGIEVFRSYIPGLAFPWGLLATPLSPFPSIIQSAYFGSIFLVGAWVALANLLVARWMDGEGFARLRPLATALLLVLALSFARFSSPEPGRKVTVTVGQPGVDMAFEDPEKQKQELAASVAALYQGARDQNAALLVLPEGITTLPGDFPPEAPFQIDTGVPVIMGGRRGNSPAYQSAFAFDGKKWTYADKTRLVIFGEFVPGRNWIPFLSKFNLPSGDLSAGERLTTLTINDLRIGPLICFEALFPDLAFRQAKNGAQILTVMSIDDWYMGSGGPEQLRAEAIWRAVETGLPLVRSASLGATLAVDSHGRVLREAPLGKTIPLNAEVPIPDKAEPFPFYPVSPALMLVSLAVAAAAPRLPKRSEAAKKRPSKR